MITEKKAAAKDGGAMQADAHGQADVLAGGGDHDAQTQTRYSGHGQIPDVAPLRDATSPTASQRAYGEVGRSGRGERDEDASATTTTTTAAATTTGANDSGGPLSDRFKGDGTLASVELDERTLKLGDTGRSVRKVQQALFDLNYGPITVNGTYDAATVACVKRFQGDHKLAKTDGELDSTTFETIERQFSSLAAYADAAHHAPPGLQHTPFKTDAKDVPVHLAETRELDDEDRAEADIVISDTRTGASGKAPAAFKPEVDGKTYGQRVEELLVEKIAKDKSRGQAIKAAHDKGKLFTMEAMESVGNAAKGQVDKVFGSFAEGPSFEAGTNLVDRFEADTEEHAQQGPKANHRDAVRRLQYLLNQHDGFAAINHMHAANPTRDREKAILERCIQNIATQHEEDVLFIISTAAANTDRETRTVSLQRHKTGKADADRKTLWKKFATMVHEYVHVLAHPNWHANRTAKGKSDQQAGNTLGEGVPELLARTVLSQVNFHDKALRKAVLGSTKDDGEVPEIDRGYDAPFAHAMSLVGVVGIHNVYAAYFLGETKLIGS
ncbi:MAG TPA: peptidoglycan-binding domain-containing protein [Kofleriaceae bacterium]|nr:peptidoglycan-binding domain-containing protein [Kofleriaceae bacterium]